MPTPPTHSSSWLLCAALSCACTFEPWLRADLGGHGDASRGEGDDADPTSSTDSGTDGSTGGSTEAPTDVDAEGSTAPEDGDDGDASRGEGDDADPTLSMSTEAPTDVDGDGFAAPEDCDDGDAQVFPGQAAYFTEASAAGSFDYDCSGTADLEFPSFTTCDPPVCGDVAGWRIAAPVPECGVEGEWESGYCQHEGGDPEHPPYCSGGDIPSPRVQGCR